MIAIDTNLVVRYLTADDLDQTSRARQIINNDIVFVPTTVMLEVEWVLRSIYRLSRSDCLNGMRDFAGLPTVTIEDSTVVAKALDLFGQGMDFADALHLLKAQHCETFVTFDRKFMKAAQAAGYETVQEA
jgi:predicted nucleic-acid-binding protein